MKVEGQQIVSKLSERIGQLEVEIAILSIQNEQLKKENEQHEQPQEAFA
ncbi:hypothetical protein [Paenisporosarcina sp. OV554]|nr:hypothetical protein [Paenisporosarcina sp. OV554]PUB17946.1 hypothetical protein C8K15_101145 [Paenisporosarcina sp. OV554]